MPKSILSSLETKTPAFWKWANAVTQQKSVTSIWDADVVAKRTYERLSKLQAK